MNELFSVFPKVIMLMNDAEEKLFRKYEKQLDEHYKTLPFWSFSRPHAIYSVLTIPDAVFLVPMMVPGRPQVKLGLAQCFKQAEDGVSQALRWLTNDGFTGVKSVADHDVINQANVFTKFASDYVDIADFHRMYGRGLVSVHIEGSLKTATFEIKDGPGQSDVYAQWEQVRDQSKRGQLFASEMMEKNPYEAKRIIEDIEYFLKDGCIQLEEFPENIVASTRDLFAHRCYELLPLPGDSEMLGFTMDEYWRFIDAITVWSCIAFMKYVRCVWGGVPQHKCMPTQIVEKSKFVERMAFISRLSFAVIQEILTRLTYNPSPKAEILLTPFLCGENTVSWSPAIIMKYRHERNLLKIMTRGCSKMKNHADTINGARDKPLCQLIAKEFEQQGYQKKLDTPIAAKGDNTDIDVLVYQTKRPDEVLIIEAKALISPDEINEVSEASKSIRYAQDQVRRAKKILAAMTVAEKTQKFKFVNWKRIKKVYGVVIANDAEPHSTIDNKEIPAITLSCLRTRFCKRELKSPSRFWDACVARAWQNKEI